MRLSWCTLVLTCATGCQLAVREFQPRRVFAEADKVYVYSADGGTALEVDPRDLTWRQLCAEVRDFDVDAEGLAVLRRLDLRLEDCSADAQFTRHGLVVSLDRMGLRFQPKRGTSRPAPTVDAHLKWTAIDYSRDRVWAWSVSRGLVSLAPGDVDWQEASIVSDRTKPPVEPRLLAFGRRRFAFVDGDTLYFGEPEPAALRLRGAFQFDRPICGLHFNARDSDTVLLYDGSRLWIWDLVAQRGERLPQKCAYSPWLYYDLRARRLLVMHDHYLKLIPETGPPVVRRIMGERGGFGGFPIFGWGH